MSTRLTSIDLAALDAVTGGAARAGGSNIDTLIGQLNSISGAIKDITQKTSGFDSNQMMMLCMLAIQNRSANSVVYVNRPGTWW